MATAFKVKPTHKAVKSYYAALGAYANQSVEHEGALRSAFQNLLSETGRKVGWTLIPELSLDADGHQIRPDGSDPAFAAARIRPPAHRPVQDPAGARRSASSKRSPKPLACSTPTR